MMMVTLSNGTESQRVAQADSYPGYDGWTVSDAYEWPTLDMLKADKHAAVKALRAAKESGTCSTPSGAVQIDDTSKIKINGLATMATIAKGAAQPFSVGFILADNTVATLDADAAIGMSMAVGTYVSGLYARSVELFSEIANAADATALDAIDITAGWQ